MDEACDRPATVVLVADDGTEAVVGRLDARVPCLGLVDALARLQLMARRQGRSVRVRDAPDELCRLVGLAGLADVLALEPWREPEAGEQLGVEEVVEPGDGAV